MEDSPVKYDWELRIAYIRIAFSIFSPWLRTLQSLLLKVETQERTMNSTFILYALMSARNEQKMR